MREVTGIFIQHQEIDPAAIRAQRLQELKDVAEWRARRMAEYRAWSDPVAVAKRKEEHAANAAAALEMGRAMSAQAKAQIAQRKADEEIKKLPNIFVKPLYKPVVKRKWYQFILDWFK